MITALAKSFILVTPYCALQNITKNNRHPPVHPPHESYIEHLGNDYCYEYGAGCFFGDIHNLPHYKHAQQYQHPISHYCHGRRLHSQGDVNRFYLLVQRYHPFYPQPFVANH